MARWILSVAIALLVLPAVSCKSDGSDVEEDTATDALPEVTPDTEEEDVAAEPEPDLVEDTGPECVYPPPPHGFLALGDTVGPSMWPGSMKGAEEISDLEHADFEAFYCDPDVHSIVVFLASTTCPYCPARIVNTVGLQSHYDTYGAKFVWILVDGTSAADSLSYFGSHGADFGWFTSDEDNALGFKAIASTTLAEGVPWIFVIEPDTMELLYSNPGSLYSITRDMYND